MKKAMLSTNNSYRKLTETVNREVKIGADLYNPGIDLWHFDDSFEMKFEAIRFFKVAKEYQNRDAACWLDKNWMKVKEINGEKDRLSNSL